MPRDDVWRLTWRELFREIVLWVEAKRDQHNRDMTLAWQTANLSKPKKLPPIHKYLLRAPDENTQSFDEQKAMLAKLSKNFGGKVQTVRLYG